MDLNSLANIAASSSDAGVVTVPTHAKVMLLSEGEKVQFDSAKEYLVKKAFRATGKVFGSREAICSVIPLPFSSDVGIALVGFIAEKCSVDQAVAINIAQAMIDSIMAAQAKIYDDAAVNYDAKAIRDSIVLADVSLAGISAYLADSGSLGNNGAGRPADEVIEAVFNDVIGAQLVGMLTEKGLTDTDKLATVLADYRGRFMALTGKKKLESGELESMKRLLDATKANAELVSESKDEVITYCMGQIDSRLAKFAKQMESLI